MSIQRSAVVTPRGYRGLGNGRASYIEAPPEWRATTVQACGLFPWAVGGSTPTIGVPLGRHLLTATTVCFDPMSWFETGRLIGNPSLFTLGLPALGKSTLNRRIALGLIAQGIQILALGDLKPDYADLIREIDGLVVKIGRGLGSINVLDVGALAAAIRLLPPEQADALAEIAHQRRLSVVAGLIQLGRRAPILDHENNVLSAAIRHLIERHSDAESAAARHTEQGSPMPTLVDLVRVIDEAPDSVRAVALDRGDMGAYRATVDPLQRSLIGLLEGPLGKTFSRPTSTPINLDSPAVCVDVSGIGTADESLQAAALLACWSDGYGAVEAANALADAGLAPQRHFFMILDELWRVLRTGGVGMVEKVDSLTRLNRNDGVGQGMTTHTMSDLNALADPADIAKARGFIERAGALICGGLPSHELDDLASVVPFTRSEYDMITSWSTPESWDPRSAPPGQGNFMLKIGRRPGVPFHVDLTNAELLSRIHDTNKRWNTAPARPTGLLPGQALLDGAVS